MALYVLEVGISDHHSLIVTALRSQLRAMQKNLYPDYSLFDVKNFKACVHFFWKVKIHQVQKPRWNCNYNKCLPL